jgi:hypothetical protein
LAHAAELSWDRSAELLLGAWRSAAQGAAG